MLRKNPSRVPIPQLAPLSTSPPAPNQHLHPPHTRRSQVRRGVGPKARASEREREEKKRARKIAAAPSLLVRRGDAASGVTTSVVRLLDRRSGASESREWAFQREVEAALYGNGFAGQTGAVYRLLKRSGVQGHTLPLKKACIQQGIVTQAEFEWLRDYLGDVRSFTLIPLDALRSALSVYGREERSTALVAALGLSARAANSRGRS